MYNNFNSKKLVVFTVCLCFLGLAIATGVTWSYFYKNGSYDITGQVVSWSFKADDNASSFTKNLGDIIPGSSGSFTVSLDASGSTTDVKCFLTPNIPDSLSGMKIYSDSGYTNLITEDNPYVQVVTAGSTSSATLYWVWEYDTGLLTSSNVSFSINVVGKQITSS